MFTGGGPDLDCRFLLIGCVGEGGGGARARARCPPGDLDYRPCLAGKQVHTNEGYGNFARCSLGGEPDLDCRFLLIGMVVLGRAMSIPVDWDGGAGAPCPPGDLDYRPCSGRETGPDGWGSGNFARCSLCLCVGGWGSPELSVPDVWGGGAQRLPGNLDYRPCCGRETGPNGWGLG